MEQNHNVLINIGSLTSLLAPITAFCLNAAPILTVLTTIVGLCWYGVLFYDRFKKRRS